MCEYTLAMHFSDGFHFFFRFLTPFCICLLINGINTIKFTTQNQNATKEFLLDCDVKTRRDHYWPEFSYCRVSKVDLSANAVDRKYLFSVLTKNINLISAVFFERCNQVEFIPKEVLQQFVSLNGLNIYRSYMPVVKNGFFTADFVRIEYLQLAANRIEVIESDAFKSLTKLKWLDLYQNKLQHLNEKIFVNNRWMKFISFHANLIESMNVELFDGMEELKFVELRANECGGAHFGCLEDGRCFAQLSWLKASLQRCSANGKSGRDKSQLTCLTRTGNRTDGTKFHRCQVFHVDLSSRKQTFNFKVLSEKILKITDVQFGQSEQVNFIPSEMFQQFPSFISLSITLSKMPTVKNDLFAGDCERIEYLGLSDNKIEMVESLAFQYLWKLKWIDLSGNHIKRLVDQIFYYNFKLRVILFAEGSVEMISRRFFEHLNHLEVIDFGRNECTNDNITTTDNYSITSVEMCYNNCANDAKCASATNTKSGKEVLDCEISSDSKAHWPEFKYCGVHKVDLSESSIETNYIFNIAQNESRKMITAVQFWFGREVDFIPIEVFQQFPKLNGLWFSKYKITTLKTSLFPIHFKPLECLDLSANRIQTIEPLTFRFLTELKWLNLDYNLIQSLAHELLVNELKLTYVSFFGNRIEEIIRGIISDSSPLGYVGLGENDCVNRTFDCQDAECPLKFSHLDLSECYSNTKDRGKTKTLLVPAVTKVKLTCYYSRKEAVFWPEHQYCLVLNAKFSVKSQDFIFSRTEEQEKQTTAVKFFNSPTINFIPSEIFQQFPSLNGLSVTQSSIPTLKNELFTSECENIEYLSLGYNEIVVIEPFAFKFLKKLKWIGLHGNYMRSLNDQIFAYNIRLIYVSFWLGSTEIVNRKLFSYLTDLRLLDFRKNRCADVGLDCSSLYCISEIDQRLKPCFDNCESNEKCRVASESYVKISDDNLNINLDKGAVRTLNCAEEAELSDICRIENADLTNDTRNDEFMFAGYSATERNVTGVSFCKCFDVHFIPMQIFNEFLLLNRLEVLYSRILALRNQFFTIEFTKIRDLVLKYDQIKTIESEALVLLTRLQSIDLSFNGIEAITSNIFKKNKKLNTVNLSHNWITALNTNLVPDLPHLSKFIVDHNRCVDGDADNESNDLEACQKKCESDKSCKTQAKREADATKEKQTISCNYVGIKLENKTTCLFQTTELRRSILFEITNAKDEASRIDMVYFDSVLVVDVIPQEIVTDFPKLNSIGFKRSRIPILKAKLFRSSYSQSLKQPFRKIVEIRLKTNEIRQIEDEAFHELENLREIDLSSNKIKSINKKLFSKNLHLTKIHLYSNEIFMIQRDSFKNLKALDLSGNKCIDINFGCTAYVTCHDLNNTDTKLENCYSNYAEQEKSFNESKFLTA